MATTPTTNPIPSSAPQDLLFNAEKLDEFVNSTATTYTDRFGVVRSTLAGLAGRTIDLACSDLTTPLTVGTTTAYIRARFAFTVVEVRASLKTASSSGAVTVDINKNGTSILSTKLTIDQGEKTSVTAATPAVISTAAFADDDEISIDIDGAGTDALGLIVSLRIV